MITHMLGVQSFFRFFLHCFVLANLAASNIRVNGRTVEYLVMKLGTHSGL